MVDDRDIREILIHNINLNFRYTGVESLLAYQLILFLILEIPRKKLIREDVFFLEFESAMDLTRKFTEWACKDIEPSKTSMKSAIKSLEKTCIINFEFQSFDDDDKDVLGLEKSRYLWCCLNLKVIRDSFAPFKYDEAKHEYFEKYIIPQFDRLNTQVASYLQEGINKPKGTRKRMVSANTYQLGLRLAFEATLDDFRDKIEVKYDDGSLGTLFRKALAFETYKHVSDYLSYYFLQSNLAESSISDCLDKLKEINYIQLEWIDPDELNVIGKTDKKQLYIELYLEEPETSL